MDFIKSMKRWKAKRIKLNFILKSVIICLSGHFVTVARGHNVTTLDPFGQKTELVGSLAEAARKVNFDAPNFFMPNLGRKARFISFDSNSGDLEVNLELSVPFLTLPFENKNGNNGMLTPLLNINVKSLVVFGALMAISAFIVPLFANNNPAMQEANANNPGEDLNKYYYDHHWASKQHKRTNRGVNLNIWNLQDSLYEILFQDSSISPCVQRVICSSVVASRHYNKTTNIDKIVDFIKRNKLFDKAMNGTLIKDAIAKGNDAKGFKECSSFYKDCIINRRIIANIVKLIGT